MAMVVNVQAHSPENLCTSFRFEIGQDSAGIILQNDYIVIPTIFPENVTGLNLVFLRKLENHLFFSRQK